MNLKQVQNVEIMAPVGSYESLMAAIQGGANSVYFGIGKLNMRSKSSKNFSIDDLKKIADICKENNILRWPYHPSKRKIHYTIKDKHNTKINQEHSVLNDKKYVWIDSKEKPKPKLPSFGELVKTLEERKKLENDPKDEENE